VSCLKAAWRMSHALVRPSLRKVGLVVALLAVAGLIMIPAEIVGSSTGPSRLFAASGQSARTAPVNTYASFLDEATVAATTAAQWAAIARRNAIVVLNSWDFRLIPVLKRANPKVQVWVYKDLSGVRSDDCTTADGNCGACPQGVMDSEYLSSGIGYCWLKRNHPGWLLGAAGTGKPFELKGYPGVWEVDYGNQAYQRQWINNVLADVRRHGWDGVSVDDAFTIADSYGLAAKYRTDAAVQAATYSALQNIGHALHNAGVTAVFNVGYAPMFPGLWQRWLGPVDGLEQEFYLSWSTQPNVSNSTWRIYEDEVSSCVALHKSCWFHSGDYSPAVTAQTRGYAMVSFLLAADSRQLLAIDDIAPEAVAWQRALGAPITTMEQIAGTWRRYFASGIAIVNPTSSELTASLDGTYLDNGGHPVSTVTLPPESGSVFLRRSG
jgi:Hypothetical glycosyl hydrolase family 15